MTDRIIYTGEDGGIMIVEPARGVSIEDVMARDIPDGSDAEIVDVSVIPADRTFRDAWRKNGVEIATDMPAAKEIAHGMRRAARAVKFAPLDIGATIPANAVAAETARQAIRDGDAIFQTKIDDATDPAELKSLIDENI